jgi:aspartyl-tRNA(Asn)/glutamyl-tRNA(Gln) amidotransferase subunit A
MDLTTLTILDARKKLSAKEISARALVEAHLAVIAEKETDIHAFLHIADDAREQADAADVRIKNGEDLPLLGIPIALKDNILDKGEKATAASKILENYIASYNATVTEKLKAAGAIIIGRTNLDEFAMGSSTEHSAFGSTKNPHDYTRVPGGSSGGSAAAVAMGAALGALGSDTGGSIRQPASFCGVVGLRPSYGRNSRYGIMPMASSLDTVGPITKTVEDMAIVMEAIAGVDQLDATTVQDVVPKYSKLLNTDIAQLKIGIPKEYFEVEGIDEEVRKMVEQKIDSLKKLGCSVEPVSLPHTKYAISTYYVIVPSEDSSNLARLEGIRYGVRAQANTLFDTYADARAGGFPEEVKRRILIGTYVLSAGYYDAYYKKAQAVRTLIKKDFDEIFKQVDVLITPTSPFTAFNIGEKSSDPLSLYLADVMVSPAAVAGMPAISVPIGKTEKGLPVGIQIVGNRLKEEVAMRVAVEM